MKIIFLRMTVIELIEGRKGEIFLKVKTMTISTMIDSVSYRAATFSDKCKYQINIIVEG